MDWKEAILKNWLTSLGGLLAFCGGAALAAQQSGVNLPPVLMHWLLFAGAIGGLITGLSAKMSSNHSTLAQVTASTGEVKAAVAVAKADAAAKT